MKRTNVVSPAGDIISVTPDQVDYLLKVGYRLQSEKPEKPVKVKVKIESEVVEDGNI